jgi:hypothetical protein
MLNSINYSRSQVINYNTLTCATYPFVYVKSPYRTHVIISPSTVSRDIVGGDIYPLLLF